MQSEILIRTNEIRPVSATGQQLVLNAGESHAYATGQTNEFVYVNAESGMEINYSKDNWVSLWAGRKTHTIGNSSVIFREDTTIYGTASDSSSNAFTVRNLANAAWFSVRNDGRLDANGVVNLNNTTTVNGGNLNVRNTNGGTNKFWVSRFTSNNEALSIYIDDGHAIFDSYQDEVGN